MSVLEGTVPLVPRKAFTSVGVVCSCGKAVAGYEGVVTSCAGCGTLYLVTVMVIPSAEASQEPKP